MNIPSAVQFQIGRQRRLRGGKFQHLRKLQTIDPSACRNAFRIAYKLFDSELSVVGVEPELVELRPLCRHEQRRGRGKMRNEASVCIEALDISLPAWRAIELLQSAAGIERPALALPGLGERRVYRMLRGAAPHGRADALRLQLRRDQTFGANIQYHWRIGLRRELQMR